MHAISFANVTIVDEQSDDFLLQEFKHVANLRLEYLANVLPQPDQFTVLVQAIPKPDNEELSYSDNVDYFFRRFHPIDYLSHHMVYNPAMSRASWYALAPHSRESLLTGLLVLNDRSWDCAERAGETEAKDLRAEAKATESAATVANRLLWALRADQGSDRGSHGEAGGRASPGPAMPDGVSTEEKGPDESLNTLLAGSIHEHD